jgi:DNA polymerase, archaea type
MSAPICGVWVDSNGGVHLSLAGPAGERTEAVASLRPFAWLAAPPASASPGVSCERLVGNGHFGVLVHGEGAAALEACLSAARAEGTRDDRIRPAESQYLLQSRRRLFEGLPFSRLRRCQLDIETGSEDGSFSAAERPGDRVLAIGLRFGERERTLVLEEESDAGEAKLLSALNTVIAEEDPDTIEGHNLFRFDLEYLRTRGRRHRVEPRWGRFGQRATWRNSKLKVAERWIDFPRCDIPGRAVVDTYLLVQLHDLSARELGSYGLKEVAVAFGLSGPGSEEERTYIDGSGIQEAFRSDRARFLRYLSDDLRETRGIADVLLPTYVEQVRTFPILLQEAALRGTTTKLDLLLLEEYYHARHACPLPPEVESFEGGFTRSFREGVFRQVLHFDVASLYPTLLLAIARNPAADTLGVFLPLLRRLRTYRLEYKRLARTAEDPEVRAEAAARQASFKLLINSFYGYLGFSGARFGDGELAAEVTRRGREALQALLTALEAEGCVLLEADTDGVYVSAPEHYAEPEGLLARVGASLPDGLDLELAGRYPAMFCYKAKNYALDDGRRVILRGSALRSRGMEPFLRRLTEHLINVLLGRADEPPAARLEAVRRAIQARTLPVAELARTEALSQSPEAYERFIAGGGKPRRASAEAALLLSPRPAMGDRVTYYLADLPGSREPDWKRARPLALFDPVAAPYDVAVYLKKLDDWTERYRPFLGPSGGPAQGEMDLGA